MLRRSCAVIVAPLLLISFHILPFLHLDERSCLVVSTEQHCHHVMHALWLNRNIRKEEEFHKWKFFKDSSHDLITNCYHKSTASRRQSVNNYSCPPIVYPFFRGFIHLGAGLAVGFSGLAAGFAIGIVGDAGVRGTAQQPRLFVGMILILIFAEVLGLYGLIVAIYLYTK